MTLETDKAKEASSSEGVDSMSLYVKEWLIQRHTGEIPSPLTKREIRSLSEKSAQCLRNRALLIDKNSWEPLLSETKSWVVQQSPEEEPDFLQAEDYQKLLQLSLEKDLDRVLKALMDPAAASFPRERLEIIEFSGSGEDPLYFLKEHLDSGL